MSLTCPERETKVVKANYFTDRSCFASIFVAQAQVEYSSPSRQIIVVKTLLQYLTNSKISCFSSNCFSSLRDNRCGRPAAVRPTPSVDADVDPLPAVLLAPAVAPQPANPQQPAPLIPPPNPPPPFVAACPPPPDMHWDSFCVSTLRNVGVPSIVLTIGFSRPPLSNSCADILLEKDTNSVLIEFASSSRRAASLTGLELWHRNHRAMSNCLRRPIRSHNQHHGASARPTSHCCCCSASHGSLAMHPPPGASPSG